MKVDKELWLDRIMNSTDGISSAESNPFIYEKIKFKLTEKKTVNNALLILKWRVIAALALLVILNGAIALSYLPASVEQPVQSDYNNLGIELGLQTSYNY